MRYSFLFLLILVFSSSCVRYFAPAMTMHDETYTAKPFLSPRDTLQKYIQNVYASANLCLNSQIALFQEAPNSTESIMAQIHHAHSFRYFNLAYAVQGTIGRHEVPPPPAPTNSNPTSQYPIQEQGYKGFQALGARFEANVKAPFTGHYFEWRALGFTYNYSKEFGNYLAFRRRLNPTSGLFYSTDSDIFSWGLNSEFYWQMGKRNPNLKNYGIGFKVGYFSTRYEALQASGTTTNERNIRHHGWVNTLHFNSKKYHFSYQMCFLSNVVISGISHKLQFTTNLSALVGKKK